LTNLNEIQAEYNQISKIKIELKPIYIPPMIDVNLKELAQKINQIVFVINELGITIYKEDAAAMEKWREFLKENKDGKK
jgi:hypothetical protein